MTLSMVDVKSVTHLGFRLSLTGMGLIKFYALNAGVTNTRIKNFTVIGSLDQMTPQQIKEQAPDGATQYAIDRHEIIYLKDDGTMVYFRHIGWEPSDTNYVFKFHLKPL